MSSIPYRIAASQVRSRLLNMAGALWEQLPGYSDRDLDWLAGQMAPRVLAGQVRIANLTAADIANQLGIKPQLVEQGLVTGGRGVAATEVYGRPVVAVRAALSRGETIVEAMQRGKNRLDSLVSTDLQMAKVRQADFSLQSAGVTKYRRVLNGDKNCALCVIASTQRYHVGNLLPIHPGCVPGDSPVAFPTDSASVGGEFAWGSLHAVSRRLLEGELVEFTTARGDQVRVTPNHPVLTDQGWLPAHLIGVGDAVFRSGQRQREVVGRPDVHQGPVLAKDVFDAARMAFPLVRMPLAAKDFHADSAEGEVEIVYTNGRFPTKRDTQLVEVPGERGLMNAHRGRLQLHGGGTFGALFPSGLTPLGGGVGGRHLGGDLFGGHLGSPQFSGTRPSPRFDAPADEFSPENAAVYARNGLDLQRRLSGLVERDRVIEKRLIGFRDHVFNLHTSEGWYSSANHIVSNCDCGVDPITSKTRLPQVIDLDLLEDAHGAVAALTGVADRGGRAPDYRKLLITREHGEMGPMLTWRGQKFTSLADLPK